MATRLKAKKIQRQSASGGAMEALKRFETKMMRKQLSKNTNLRLGANPRKLFSFNTKF